MAGGVALGVTLGAVLAGGLSGCGAPPPPPVPPTVVMLKLSAGADVNPTQAGQAAPVVVRVYQLASPAGFEGAEFFKLLNADTATLGSDLVKKEEVLLAPGSARASTLTLPDAVHALGVFAAYRNFRDVTWRVVVPVEAHKTATVDVTAAATGLRVSP